MPVSIRLNQEERELAERYAALHASTLSEVFKKALFEKIEEEFDIAAGESAYAEYTQGGKKSRPIEELWEECGL